MERVISISSETDFLRQSGAVFVDNLRLDAARHDAPEAVRRDWTIIAKWLDHSTGDLSLDQHRRIERAWLAYLAIGAAPSHKLQPAFSMFAGQLVGTDKADRAPTAVMDVFDRLIASDADIERKRAADMNATKAQLQPLLDRLNHDRRPRWWRRQSGLVRRWIFAAVLWALLMFVVFRFFDPFDVGGWDRLDDEEMVQFALIVLAPVAAGAAFYIYRRWVG